MSPSRALTRWALPAGLAVAAVGASLIAPMVASAEPDLPEHSAAELLADLRTEPIDGMSGTAVYRADLGLPTLPGLTGDGGPGRGPAGGSTGLATLLDGEHTMRLWASGPDRARVSVHGDLAELTLVRNGDDLWTWSSDEGAVTHLRLPERAAHADSADSRALADRLGAALPPMTPEGLAGLVLDVLDPSTAVSVGDAVTVAGRPAYQLVLEPRTDGTLVDSVRIAIDAADRVPTRVQVFAVGHDRPALEVGFTALSLVPPDDDVFAFTPPPGAMVEEIDPTGVDARAKEWRSEGDERSGSPWSQADGPPVTVVGEGWASVLVAALPADLGGQADDAAPVLESLPRVEGAWGSGRLLTSRLFSALLTDDGRVLLGAVDAATLQRMAADTSVPAG